MLKLRLAEARKANGDEGFTLIELLIVIVVMGVLAGIVVFGVGTFRGDAQKSAACANTETVQVAAQAAMAGSPTGVPVASIALLVSGGYLEELPSPLPIYTTTGTPASDFTVAPPTGFTC